MKLSWLRLDRTTTLQLGGRECLLCDLSLAKGWQLHPQFVLRASVSERAEPCSSVTPEQNQDYHTLFLSFPTLRDFICYPVNITTPQHFALLGGAFEMHSVFSLGCLENQFCLCCTSWESQRFCLLSARRKDSHLALPHPPPP